jgi:hypothetical protein
VNRAQIVQAIAACDALAAELRLSLKADAAAEFAEQGTAPTWRLPGYTVSTAVTHDAVEVVNDAAWLAYVREEFPTEVEVVTRARSAWQASFLADVAFRGDPPCDRDGRVIPGLAFRPGGEFASVSVRPQAATKASLRAIAADIAAGRRPLGLPQTVEVFE